MLLDFDKTIAKYANTHTHTRSEAPRFD
jgi:hypothetical protein